MLTLNDGRKEMYQWDIGRIATIDVECDVVHFSNLKYGASLAVEVKNGEVAIPNKLLTSGEPIYCWSFVEDENGKYTKQEQTLNVNKRAKPSDYVYTETDTLTWKSLDERITELEKGGTGGSCIDGEDGATFIPYVSERGIISWTNDKGLLNPEPVNIKGEPGEKGEKGETGDPGKDGNDYVLTESDKQEIADMIPSGGTTSTMTGATADTDGSAGLVPAPKAGEQDKFLRGDGTWAESDKTLSKDGYAADAKIVGEKFSELSGKIDNKGNPTDEQISNAVGNWLKDNPDAIAVQDGSITEEKLSQDVKELITGGKIERQAEIFDLPKQCARPSVASVNYVNTDTETQVIVKPAILEYAGRCLFPYTENIDGSTDDLPATSGTGVTAVKYRKFWLFNDSFLNDTTGVIAQMGTEYNDYQCNVAYMDGGCGYSSAVMLSGYVGRVYMSFVGAGKNGVNVNGKYQTLTPCTCEVTVNSDTPIGEINELTLDINGEVGKFDLARLGYTSYKSYYTTIAPYKSDKYYWCQPVPDGIAYFTSTDGIAWVYVATYKTPFDPYYEIACVVNNSYLYVACRTNYDIQKMYICKINTTNGSIQYIYYIDDIGSRPNLIMVSKRLYLCHSTTSRDTAECLQIIDNGDNRQYGLYFYRWFSWEGTSTYYPVLKVGSFVSEVNAFGNFILVGNNGVHTAYGGMSWVKMTCDTTKPFLASECDFTDPSDTSDYVLPIATSEILGGVKPVAKTDEMTQEVGVDPEGKLYTTKPGVSSVWENLVNATIDTESSTFGEITISRKIAKMKVYAKIVGTTTNGDTTNGNVKLRFNTTSFFVGANGTVLNTATSKFLMIEVETTPSGCYVIRKVNNGWNGAFPAECGFQVSTAVTSDTTIDTFEIYGSTPYGGSVTFGVGTTLLVDVIYA